MDFTPIYSVPLDQLSVDQYGRFTVERPAFVETVKSVWTFQAVLKITTNGTCSGSVNGGCNNTRCTDTTNDICNNTRCVAF